MKLELKHLAAYLPYNLKILRPDNKTTITLLGINGNLLIFNEANAEKLGHIRKNKPILRPIKDVETFKYKPRHGKEITVSKTLTIEMLEGLTSKNIDAIPYAIIEILCGIISIFSG